MKKRKPANTQGNGRQPHTARGYLKIASLFQKMTSNTASDSRDFNTFHTTQYLIMMIKHFCMKCIHILGLLCCYLSSFGIKKQFLVSSCSVWLFSPPIFLVHCVDGPGQYPVGSDQLCDQLLFFTWSCVSAILCPWPILIFFLILFHAVLCSAFFIYFFLIGPFILTYMTQDIL